MSYAKGDLKLTTSPPCPDDSEECWGPGHTHDVPDSRRPDSKGGPDRHTGAYLEHSCDEWYIGGPAELRLLIADAKGLLAELEAK